jgi:hypothetical protein
MARCARKGVSCPGGSFGVSGVTRPVCMRSYAETAINDADIQFSMEITEIGKDWFDTRVRGQIDNRNVFGATMDSTVVTLGYGGVVCWPQMKKLHKCAL